MNRLVAALLTAGLWLAGIATALAHVTVNPREAPAGGFAKFDVRVPNERPDASTVEVQLRLPRDRPIESVHIQPVPGWDVKVRTRKLIDPIKDEDGKEVKDVPSTIVWTAQPGTGIKPGEFLEFPVSMGPLPAKTGRLVFRAIQEYDSGEVVRWIEVPDEGEGASEPERPAPVVALVTGDEEAPAAAEGPSEIDAASGRSTLALIVSLIAAALAIAALMGRRRTPAPSAAPATAQE